MADNIGRPSVLTSVSQALRIKTGFIGFPINKGSAVLRNHGFSLPAVA